MTVDSPPRRRSRRPVIIAAAAVSVVVLTVGLWAFEPWRAFTSSTIDEALPSVPAEPAAASPTGQTTVPAVPAQPAPTQPAVLSEGGFVTQEHETTGTARIVQLPDGSRVLRLENLASSDGPDLHLWLTDQTAGGEWGKYDDGWFVSLGTLKATHGNQNYEIPAGQDLTQLRSVVIWCDRFNVAFGSAPLSGA